MHWMDPLKFEPLIARLAEIDRKLDHIASMSESVTVDPDALGLFDDAEGLIGEGFLLCQVYMIERKGERKDDDAYACGPRHNGSRYFAQALIAAGNYRKHRGEWASDQSKWKREHRTLAVFKDIGVDEGECLLSNVLVSLTKPAPPRFASLVSRLTEWNAAVDLLAK